MSESREASSPEARAGPRSRLAFKYAALMISVMGAVLVVNGLVTMWMSFADQKAKLAEQQKLEAQLAATKISQFVREIEAQLQWMLMAPWASSSLEDRRIDGLRILRNTPAIAELALVGADGREELKLSRLATDQIGSGADWSREPAIAAVAPDRPYHGPVYHQRNSEPYMRIAMVGARRSAGIVVADVNLKLIWDVVAPKSASASGASPMSLTLPVGSSPIPISASCSGTRMQRGSTRCGSRLGHGRTRPGD